MLSFRLSKCIFLQFLRRATACQSASCNGRWRGNPHHAAPAVGHRQDRNGNGPQRGAENTPMHDNTCVGGLRTPQQPPGTVRLRPQSHCTSSRARPTTDALCARACVACVRGSRRTSAWPAVLTAAKHTRTRNRASRVCQYERSVGVGERASQHSAPVVIIMTGAQPGAQTCSQHFG